MKCVVLAVVFVTQPIAGVQTTALRLLGHLIHAHHGAGAIAMAKKKLSAKEKERRDNQSLLRLLKNLHVKKPDAELAQYIRDLQK